MARNYKKEYRDFHGKPEQIARRSERNQSRRKMVAAGAKVRGKDIHHIDGNPGNKRMSNMRVTSVRFNRGKK
jgi:hypothetical protein